MKKRILSLLLSLILILGQLPAAAFAAENVSGPGQDLQADSPYQVTADTAAIMLAAENGGTHVSHPACGVDSCPKHLRTLYEMYLEAANVSTAEEKTHSADGINWQPLNSSTISEFLGLAEAYRTKEPNEKNRSAQYWYYYLDEDLTIDGDGWVLDGFLSDNGDANYTICLNGHTITCSTNAGKPAIKVGGEESEGYHAVLNICDCGGGGTIKLSDGNNGPAIQVANKYSIMNLYGGTITGVNKNGVGVEVAAIGSNGNYGTRPDTAGYEYAVLSASFYMNGGKITNTATGVDNKGKFDMVGGEISGNDIGVRYQENEYIGKSEAINAMRDNCTLYFRLGAGAVIQNNTKADLNPVHTLSNSKLGPVGSEKNYDIYPRVTLTPEDGELKWVPMKLYYDGKMQNKTAITDDNEADYSQYFTSAQDQYAVYDVVDEDRTYPYGADGQVKQFKHHVRLLGNSEDPQITVTDQPTAPTLTEGQSPAGQELKVTASGSGALTYQWYYSEENTTNYTDSSVEKVEKSNGGNTATCTIPKLKAGQTYYFFCVITDSSNHVRIAGPVEIVFPELGELRITSQPTLSELQDGKGPRGQELSVTADGGSGNYTYKWYWNNKKSTEGADSEFDAIEAEYKIEGYSSYNDNPMYFYCVVTDTDTGKTVTTDFVEVNFGPRITQQPKAPAGDPVGKPMTVEAQKPGTGKLSYQWYWSDTAAPGDGTAIYQGGTSKTLTIPDLGSGDKYIYCVITYMDGSIKTTTDVVKVNFSAEDVPAPTINTQPAAPSVPEGQSPVGQTLTVAATSSDGGTLTYQWYYNTADSTTGGTKVSPNGTSASCTIPELKPGTYYFYCVVTGADGGEAVTNTVKIVIPEATKLEPGQTITLDDGTEIERTGDGGTVTITKPGGSTVTTVTLPDDNKTGEVTVNTTTGEVKVPEGSKVTTTGGSGSGSKPDIILGGDGGSVLPGGEVKVPEGGSATVDGGQGGGNNPVTTVTGGQGGTTVTPKDDGTVDVSGGGTVKTPGTGGNGVEINLPGGGNVTPGTGAVNPEDNTIAVGQDTNGDGVPDTLIVLPEASGGGSSTVTPNSDGSLPLPGGTQVKGGGTGDGSGGASVTLPGGGTITAPGGSVKPGGDGKVTTGADHKTEVTIPSGGELKGDGEGGLTVPGGTTLKNGENGSKITVGGDGGTSGGTLTEDGGVKLPGGGSATVDNGSGKPGVTITGGSGGGTVTPNPDGSTGVSGSGVKIQIGGEDSGKPPVTLDGQDGTVKDNGEIELKDGASVTVGGENGKPGATITAPGHQGGTPGSATVTPKEDGTVDVSGGGIVKPAGGPEVTVGGQGGTVEPDGTLTLPSGGQVSVEHGGSTTTVTYPSGGAVTPTDGGQGLQVPAGGAVSVTDGTDTTTVTVPAGSGITPNGDGTLTIPAGSRITKPDGSTVEVSEETTIHPDGTEAGGGNNITGQYQVGPQTTVTIPDGKSGTRNGDGSVTVPAGSTVMTGSGPVITADTDNTTVMPDGTITVPSGGKLTIKHGGTTTTITVPGGGDVAPSGDGKSVKVPAGSTMSMTDGRNTTAITLPGGGTVTPNSDGTLTVPAGSKITKPDGSTVTVTEKSVVKPDGTVTGAGSSERVPLAAGGSTTTGDGTTVQRSEDGKMLTITPADGTPPTDITLPDPKGNVTVDKDNNKITVPEGSIVKTSDPSSAKPAITTGQGGVTVTTDGGVELSNGGTATVGGGSSGKPTTTITGGQGGAATVTPKSDGTVDVTGSGSVKTGGDEGVEITLPKGGNVDPSTGAVKPVGNTAGVDTTGDGKADTTIVLPGEHTSGDGGDTITPTGDGKVKVPGGSAIKSDGEDSPAIKVPQGGTVDPKSGTITAPEVEVTGSSITTTITPPAGGVVNTDKSGTTGVSAGSTIASGDITVIVQTGDGTVDKDGTVTFPKGGFVSITKGSQSTTTNINDGGSISVDSAKASEVSGSVIKQDSGIIEGANVTLKRGITKIASTKTDANGEYIFLCIPNGAYNIVAEANGKTKTALIKFDQNKKGIQLMMPSENVNSILEVKESVVKDTGADVTGTVAGGLDEEAEALAKELNDPSQTITLTMTVEAQEETKAPNADKIRTEAGRGQGKKLEFLAINLVKKVNDETSAVTQTKKLLTIIIPFDFTNRDDVKVYRYHDNKVDTLTDAVDENQERIEVDRENSSITMYVKNFSTYAIGYKETNPVEPPVSPSGSGDGSTTSNASVKKSGHGGVSISPRNPKKGDTVTITTTPDKGYVVSKVTVKDTKGQTVTVKDNGSGTYSYTQPAGRVRIEVEFQPAQSAGGWQTCTGDASCPMSAFTDTDAQEWYHDGVHYCVEKGLMKGYSDSAFGPQNFLSRAMLAQILHSWAGYPAVSGRSPFDDVAADAWYADAIAWAADNGIVGGYGSGKFGPDDPITREQLAAMLYRCAQTGAEDVLMGEDGDIRSYKDYGEISEYAVPALQWAVGSGIVSGKGDGILDPTGRATRAEAATMLMRFCEIAD